MKKSKKFQLNVLFILFLISLLQVGCAPSVVAQTSDSTIRWADAQLQSSSWYEGREAVRIADNVLMYQHESGGWPKNLDMASRLSEKEKERIKEEKKSEDSSLNEITIDNGATVAQIRYLVKVYAATEQDRFKEGVLKGLDYLLEAQYDNGGWPQFYPLRDGYYENITYNDGAMIRVMDTLRNVAKGESLYSFVDEARRQQAADAINRGLRVILDTQVEVDGELTVWCAQYDPVTLRPAKARSYELISLSGSESVGIVNYLMEIDNPSPEVITAVKSAVAWFDKVKITDVRIVDVDRPELSEGYDQVIGFDPTGESLLWARFYEIGTNYPMFVDREGTVHAAFSELPYERRINYLWLGDWAQNLLEKDYPNWLSRIQ